MWHILKAYLCFLWRSTNEHGVHSPFVFSFVTKCLYDKSAYAEYNLIDRHRETLLHDTASIKVIDFGAGSRIFTSDLRKVSRIAKHAGISRKRAHMLFRISSRLKPQHILELGTSVGLASVALAYGNRKAAVTTIEGCPNTASVAEEHFKNTGLSNIDLRQQDFDSFLPGYLHHDRQSELIYIDGNHSREATIKYFEILVESVHADAVWIFDDIHWSAQMEQVWEIIKKHPKVTVTIDTFQWGVVFFRGGQVKEHFTIRC